MPCRRSDDSAVKLWKTSGHGPDRPHAAGCPTVDAHRGCATGSLELEEELSLRASRAAETVASWAYYTSNCGVVQRQHRRSTGDRRGC